MAQLKSIRDVGVRRVMSLSIINNIMNDRTTIVLDPEIREMINDASEFHDWKGKRTEEPRKTIRTKDYTLSDEQFEAISVCLLKNVAQGKDEDEQELSDKAKANFDQYNHHHFIRRWGLLEVRKTKDEEWWIENPANHNESDPQYLCEMCRHINFKVLFNKRGIPGNDLPGPTRIQLYALHRILTNEKCAFCRLLCRKIRQDGLLNLNDMDAHVGSCICLIILDEGLGFALRMEVEMENMPQEPNLQRLQRLVIQKIEVENPIPHEGLPVSLEQASLELLSRWLDLCESTHPDITDRKLQVGFSHLRLIDVEGNRIVEAEYPCRYVCLSYVWGRIKQLQYNRETKSLLEQINGLISVQLPQTITDAMAVTKAIQVRYLWVDSLCILQDDDADKAQIIADMGAIYSNAVLTITASTNIDSTGGLPGVTSVPRSRGQIVETIQGMQLAAVFHDHRKTIADVEASTWNSRGWTYQEQQLSKRSVYFTDSQMCFICPHCTFFEDTSPVLDSTFKPCVIPDKVDHANTHHIWMKIWKDPSQSHFPNKGFLCEDSITVMQAEDLNEPDGESKAPTPIYKYKQVQHINPSGKMPIQGENLWNIYRVATNSYTQRQLTWDKDAIDAFHGMSELIRQGANTRFWYALPDFAFDQALLWYPKGPLQRRKDTDGEELFPSWTWAAWKGEVHYRSRGWYNALYRGPVCAVEWLQRQTAEEAIKSIQQNHRLAPTDIEEIKKLMEGMEFVFSKTDPFKLYNLYYQEHGWECFRDPVRNQLSYIHQKYPGIRFSYPIALPEEEIIQRPDQGGKLYYKARTVPVRFCDMNKTDFIQAPFKENFIQIGLEDEKRSANCRRPSQRILYHQGYRAGSIELNISIDDIVLAAEDELYYLAAMSRDELTRIAPPVEGWELYWYLSPVELHYHISSKEEWDMDTKTRNIPPPNDEVTPDTSPKNENGDAYWDEGRFTSHLVYGLYNVLLLQKIGRFSERIGVGKINYHAFHHASPTVAIINLK